MNTFDMVLILQSAAKQWADYLEDSKEFGESNLETDQEIANIDDALQQCTYFLESIKDLGIPTDVKRAMSGVMKIVENLG
jgi:hypothetical protein